MTYHPAIVFVKEIPRMWKEIVPSALMITGFVLAMMLLIEYLNVLTRGKFDEKLARCKTGQVAIASVLGALPGCLGSFAAVSMYAHRVITFGAVTATMIATSGDEAFVMLSLFPREALIIFATLLVLGLATGWLIDRISEKRITHELHPADYQPVHKNEARCVCFSWNEFIGQWKKCSAHRGLLTLMLLFFLGGVINGNIGHGHLAEKPAIESCDLDHTHEYQHEAIETHELGHQPESAECDHAGHDDWVKITLLLAGLIGLFVAVSVPDHFLEEHLWRHLVCVHVWRIFLWTLGALFITHLLVESLHFEGIIQKNRFVVMLIACLIGLIPQSGPHLLFVTLFAQGLIPFPTLLASCIVQDGHGMIPMLAHSRSAFFSIKLINLIIGLLVGAIGLLLS
jgi:hypothetical protein